jgi:glutathione S-transferase
VLEVDGKVFAQSVALSRYACKVGGLYPTDPVAALEADEVRLEQQPAAASALAFWPSSPLSMCSLSFNLSLSPCLSPLQIVATLDELWCKVPAKDEALRVAYGTEVAPKYLQAIAKRLGSGPFFLGSATPGFADLWVYQFVSFFTSGFFDFLPKDFVEKAAPTLVEHAAAVKASALYTAHGTPE